MKIVLWFFAGLLMLVSVSLITSGAIFGGLVCLALNILSTPYLHRRACERAQKDGKPYGVRLGLHTFGFTFLWLIAFVYFLPSGGADNEEAAAPTASQVEAQVVVEEDPKPAPPKQPMAQAEIDRYAKQVHGLWQELQGFRHDPDFHYFGLGAGGPYGDWGDRRKALALEYSEAIQKTPLEQRFQIGLSEPLSFMYSIALDWMKSQGRDTKMTREMSDMIEETFSRHNLSAD